MLGTNQRNIYILMENIKDLTYSEREIVNFLLTERKPRLNITINELGDKTYTSASTVTRLYKKLGYNSFNEFRSHLNSDLAKYVESRLSEIAKEYISIEDDVETIIRKTTNNSVSALFSVTKLNSAETFQKVVDCIKNAETVHFLGSGVSNLICRDVVQKALRSGISATAHMYHMERLMQVRVLNPEDIAIIVSYTGEAQEILHLVQVLKDRNIQTISITSDTNNSIANSCDINLFVDYRESFYRVGGMDSRMSVQHVLDIIFSILFSQSENARDNIQKSLNREDF